MHKWVKKDFWKKGASEILSFIVLAPVMLILFALLESLVQSESLKEKLEYTTYVAARAAALSESLPAAQANAEQAAKVDLASYGADYDPNSLRVTVYPDSSSKWTKGSYFKCEVSVNFRGVTSLVNRKKGFSLVMAVEHEIPSNVQAGTAQ